MKAFGRLLRIAGLIIALTAGALAAGGVASAQQDGGDRLTADWGQSLAREVVTRLGTMDPAAVSRMHGSGGHHSGDVAMRHHATRPGGGMSGHHGQHEDMPEECQAMHADPEMMGHMMDMMHGTMGPAECAAWMTERGYDTDDLARCLELMSRHHGPDGPERPGRMPEPT